jgi:hypothetical protein
MLHHRIEIPTNKPQEGCTGKDDVPTRGFAASPEVGPRTTVDTLKIGYPHVQALSQDKRQDERACLRVPWLRLTTQGSSTAATCPVALAPVSWLRAAPYLPRAS